MPDIIKSNGRAIQQWDSRDNVRELAERLKMMTPGGSKLDNNELLALAQGAVAHGLDPLNGEIWMIPGRGLMVGVKGLRKKAREQVQGNFWIEFNQLINPEERKALGIPDGAMAFETRLFDSENIRTYAETAERLLKAGIPWDAVSKMIGNKPYTTGIGILKPGENTKMDRVQCAMKRAEADALKRRFDVPFGFAVETDEEEPQYTGEWIENQPPEKTSGGSEYVPDADEIDKALAEKQALHEKRQAGSKALFGDE